MAQQSTSGSIGAGQQFPSNSNTDFDVICFIVRQMIALLDTMKLVQVIAVHPGNGSPPVAGTVDVQLLVNQLDGAGNYTPNGIVYGLPFFRLQGGPWAVICDPAVNDYGYVIASDRDSSLVVKTPGQANPGSRRKYSISDGVYVGGCLNAVPAATIYLKGDGTFTITDSKGNVVQSSSSGIAITGNLSVTGTINATQEITAKHGTGSSVTMTGHTHAQGVDSHGDTEVPTNAPTGGT